MRVRLAGRCDACIVCDRPRRRDCGQGPRVRVVAQGRDAGKKHLHRTKRTGLVTICLRGWWTGNAPPPLPSRALPPVLAAWPSKFRVIPYREVPYLT